MSQRIATITGLLALAIGAGWPALHAAGAKSALPAKTVITANAGSLSTHGDTFSATFEHNVRLTSLRNGLPLTLICQRLAANGTKADISEAKASEVAKFTMVVQLMEDTGLPAKYQIEAIGESVGMKGRTLLITAPQNGAQARLKMTPVDDNGTRNATVVADHIEFHLDADEAMRNTPAAKSQPFVVAVGDASVTASVKSVTINDKASEPYKLEVSAARITGLKERGAGGTVVDCYHLEKAGGPRPHMKFVNLNPAAPKNATLDADAITVYPALLTLSGIQSGDPLPSPTVAMSATGDVRFAGTERKTDFSGRSGQLYYRLYRVNDPARSYDRVLYLRGNTDGGDPPVMSMRTSKTPEPPPSFTAAHFMFNLDNGDYIGAPTEAGAEDGVGVKGGKP